MKRLAMFAVMVLVGSGLVAPGATAGSSSSGFFSHCQVSHFGMMDPIMSPGRMSAHRHEFFGNTTTDASSTLRSMLAGNTTCSAAGDTAGYWVPALVRPNGRVVKAAVANVYYRPAGAQHVYPFPQDLRMISHKSSWHCGVGPGTNRPQRCGHRYVRASIEFPSCWNGTDLDSPDHMSHLTFDRGARCEGVSVPKITLDVRYPIHDGTGYTLSSGPPRTLHADFWNTWQPDELAAVVDACLNSSRACGRVKGSMT